MKLITEPYLAQVARWPRTGRHILAHFDDESIVVYQAYCPSIGLFAAEHGYFGEGFRFNRMSWIKTSFLWMMYRSGWGTKADQEVVLAVWMKRPAFDAVLEQAVHSRFIPELHGSRSEWEQAVARSSVRLQWDPDRDPSGTRMDRRAIQLRLRRDALAEYAREWIVGIEDISDFVKQQRQHARANPYSQLITPRERVYPVNDPRLVAALGLSAAGMN